MAADWKSAYADMQVRGEAAFPPAGLHYVLQLTRLAAQVHEGHAITPEQLLEDFRRQTRRDFGALVSTVLEDWKFHSPEDLGRAVVLLGQYGCLTLDAADTVESFSLLGTEL